MGEGRELAVGLGGLGHDAISGGRVPGNGNPERTDSRGSPMNGTISTVMISSREKQVWRERELERHRRACGRRGALAVVGVDVWRDALGHDRARC